MAYIHRTMIVPAARQALAQSLCLGVAGPAGGNMFTTGLSASGNLPATHYISAGRIEDTFAGALSDANILHAACQQAGVNITPVECSDLLADCTITDGTFSGEPEGPHATIARLGLQLVQEAI